MEKLCLAHGDICQMWVLPGPPSLAPGEERAYCRERG